MSIAPKLLEWRERRKSDDDAMDQGVRQVSMAMPFIAMQLRSTKKKKEKKEEEIHRSLT